MVYDLKDRPGLSAYFCRANTGYHGTSRNGQESFWRHVLGGAASARFHRPPSGHGLDAVAQANIRSARLLTARIDVFASRPANDLLEGRSRNEAFCLAQPGIAYALYFTDGGDLWLKSDVDVTVEWLHVPSSRWHAPLRLASENGRVHLVTPQYTGYWAAYIVP